MLQILDSCATLLEQKEKLKLILQTNTHTWSHINLKAERRPDSFDFGKKEEELIFDLDRLSKIKLSRWELLKRGFYPTRKILRKSWEIFDFSLVATKITAKH